VTLVEAERAPIADEPKLRLALIAVADMLGYSATVARASTYPEAQQLLTQYHELMRVALEALRFHIGDDENSARWQVKSYTDNFLLHTQLIEHGEFELHEALTALARFQGVLIKHGQIARGAVSLGHVYIDQEMVFGGPVIEAHALEKNIASVPRIILSNATCRLAARHFDYYGGSPPFGADGDVIEDADGQWFINYLGEGLIDQDPEFGWLIDDELFRSHADLIANGLRQYGDDARISTKYKWLATYHNWFCAIHGLDDLLVTLPGNDRLQPPGPPRPETIQRFRDSFNRRLRPDDENFNDIVEIAARPQPQGA